MSFQLLLRKLICNDESLFASPSSSATTTTSITDHDQTPDHHRHHLTLRNRINIRNEEFYLFEKALSCTTIVSSLSLKNNHIGIEKFKLLIQGLRNNKSITHFTFYEKDDIYKNEIYYHHGWLLFGKLLELDNTTIVSLNLNGMKIGTAGCIALADALKVNNTLQNLYLNNNNIKDEGCIQLALAIKKNYINTSISTLELKNNNITDDGCIALSHTLYTNTSIQTLILSDNQIGKKGYTSLSKLLRSNKTSKLIHLELGDKIVDGTNKSEILINSLCNNNTNGTIPTTACVSSLTNLTLNQIRIDIESCRGLGLMMNNNKNIQSIHLSKNYIGCYGCRELAYGIKYSTSLSKLSIQYNNIRDEGCIILSSALKTNTTLKSLDLSCNNISTEGLRALCDVLSNRKQTAATNTATNTTATTSASSITHINLSRNIITNDEGCVIIKDILMNNTTLLEIDLTANRIKDSGCDEIATGLLHNKTLRKINLQWNQITELGCTKLSNVLCNNNSNSSNANNYALVYIGLNYNKFQRVDCKPYKQIQMHLQLNEANQNLLFGRSNDNYDGCGSSLSNEQWVETLIKVRNNRDCLLYLLLSKPDLCCCDPQQQPQKQQRKRRRKRKLMKINQYYHSQRKSYCNYYYPHKSYYYLIQTEGNNMNNKITPTFNYCYVDTKAYTKNKFLFPCKVQQQKEMKMMEEKSIIEEITKEGYANDYRFAIKRQKIR